MERFYAIAQAAKPATNKGSVIFCQQSGRFIGRDTIVALDAA